MCGIAGFVSQGGKPVDPAVLVRMTRTLSHRGPDGEGYWNDERAALGHRRLSIIDIAGGAQPMPNEDQSVWVSYNGEIYNEPELRRALSQRGHRFRSQSDTECLVHLYEEQGPRFADALNGMFALALWDQKRGRIILARDRMGQKPLYYATPRPDLLVFGSEPKALLEHPEVSRQLDPNSLARYLFYEYIPSPYSIWASMRKLPPAHVLIWEPGRGGEVEIQRYWNPTAQVGENLPFDDATDQFWNEFRASVARHRRSDVPLGVFLSGGVDSSCVAAALTELEPADRIHTFSIGFDDPSFDESEHAKAVARHLGTSHHERTFSVNSVRELLPEVASWLDEPFGDASVLPTHLLSRFARTEVTVALGGDGADELLAGYPTFTAERTARLFRALPRPARALIRAAVDQLPVNMDNLSFDFRLKQFLKGAAEALPLAHQRWLGSFDGSEIQRLLACEVDVAVEQEHLHRARGLRAPSDPLSQSLALYQDTYLPDDILFKVDRASMACGLEVRAPFLDTELINLIERLPPDFKYGAKQTKRILKQAARRRLPDSILRRPKKGFGIPVAHWLRGPLAGWLDSQLGRGRLRQQGLFNPEEVERLIGEHRAGVRDHRKPLWTLLMFQLWYDQWIGGPSGAN